MSIYIHYGQNRSRDALVLGQSDVVLTTYGVLASEFSAEVFLQSLRLIITEVAKISLAVSYAEGNLPLASYAQIAGNPFA